MIGFSGALAILAGLASTAPSSTPGCAPIRVMSYNIRLDVESDGANRWSKRRNEFIGQIRLMQPDILGLQEVVAGQKADLERALPGYAFVGVARDDGKSAGEFSNLAVNRARFRIESSGTFWLSPTPQRPSKGWDAAYIRIATWAHLVRRENGERILALNTHLDNDGATARVEGAREIARFLQTHLSKGEAVIVTGDFNAEPNSPPYQALTQAPLRLRDSRLASASPAIGPEGTFNDFQALAKDQLRIDYVFADPALKVSRYAVLAWHGAGDRVASDHFPVVADLSACDR